MDPNPLLKRLGFSDTDRVVIIHIDDVGMCQASLAAYADLVDFGLISSAAVMVPCPWFPAVADYCRHHTGLDLGVHLTLNSEWDMYRWGPVSTEAVNGGLIDSEGYLFRSPDDTYRYAAPDAVQSEIAAQLNRALNAGIDVTHIDTHMGTVAHPKYSAGYIELAVQHRLPLFVPRADAHGYQVRFGMDQATAERTARTVRELEMQGVPLLDSMTALPLNQPEDRIEQAKRALSALPAGVTHFIIHAAKDSAELRAIAPDWPSRVADYQAFTSESLRNFVKTSGLQVIGYRVIRESWRATTA
ncbi:MAG: polysaccharide deacetylase family protein [Aggregatilineales bacterium]